MNGRTQLAEQPPPPGSTSAAAGGTEKLGAAERLRIAREANPVERSAAGAAASYPKPVAKVAIVNSFGVFQPSYEWQELPDGAAVPAGLNVDLPLDGAPRRARIPPTWQLRTWVSDEHGFWRCDVGRSTTALQLRQKVAQHMGVPLDTVALALRGAKLADDVTTEQCELFGLSKELAVLTV
tara:strand:+ start:525 stop:1067 length:543 start_codon:yes stop_codon:yes gene_type:complete